MTKKWKVRSAVQSRQGFVVEAKSAREAATSGAKLDRPELVHVKSTSSPGESGLGRGKAFKVYFRSNDRSAPESWERSYDDVFLYFVTNTEDNPSSHQRDVAKRLARGESIRVHRRSNPKSIEDALELLGDTDIANLAEEISTTVLSIESVENMSDLRANLDDLKDVANRFLKEIKSFEKDLASDD